MKLSKFSIVHPVIISMTLLALGVFGLVAISSTNTEFLPDISMPTIFVVTVYPGASSQDIEETVTDIMEEDFVTLPNFKSMDSQSVNSASIITITFQDGVDPYDQLDEVRNRIDQLIGSLPSGISGTPMALVGGATMLPIASFIVEGGEDLNAISDYVENDLKPKLTQIEGVSTIEINGKKEPRIDVKLRLDDMESRKISALSVYQMLSLSNFSIPLDSVEFLSHKVDAKFEGKYSSIDDVENLPVGISADGSVVRLKDIADISFVYDQGDYYVTKDGKDVITVDVSKRSDGNTVKITKEIKNILKAEEEKSGGALSFTMISDDSSLVKSSMRTVITSGVLGIIIAILVIFLFLSDIKATLVIGISIPLSIFFTFIGMKICGITVNLMSLSGIVVALGNMVGASILVLDQVYRYYQELENDKALYSVNDSILKGTDTVLGSVLGSGLTTIVVFVPIAMLSGLVGNILKDVSITFMIAISASLLISIIYIPYFLKKWLKEDDESRKPKKENIIIRGMAKVENCYQKGLEFSIDHTPFILIISLMVLVLSLYVLPRMQTSFIPSTDNGDLYVNIEMAEGYSLEETKEVIEKASNIIKEEVPEMDTYVAYSGKSMDPMSFAAKPNQGSIHIVLTPVKDRERSVHEIILDLQYKLSAILPDANVSVTNGGFDRLVSLISDGGGFGLTLVGNDIDELYQSAEIIERELQSYPEVITTSINASNDSKSAVINTTYDYLSSVGIPSTEAGMTAAILFYGTDIGKFNEKKTDQRYDIHLYSDISDKPLTEDTLSQLKVISLAGQEIALSNIATLDLESSLSQINHSDRANTLTVSAQLTTESPDGVTSKINKYIEENPLPSSVTTKVGGLGDLVNDSMGPLLNALLIAMFLCYLVMVAVFERYDQPLLVMLLFPFCIIGTVIALSAFGSSMSIVSILGVVSLIGMLVNNGIVIADYANVMRKSDRINLLNAKGIEFDEFSNELGQLSMDEELGILRSVITTGTVSRLRPILMSSLTTILGVIPMAIAKGEGAEIYAPLGQVIMGGLTTSTVITLFVMPVFYYLLERRKIRKFYGKSEKEN